MEISEYGISMFDFLAGNRFSDFIVPHVKNGFQCAGIRLDALFFGSFQRLLTLAGILSNRYAVQNYSVFCVYKSNAKSSGSTYRSGSS